MGQDTSVLQDILKYQGDTILHLHINTGRIKFQLDVLGISKSEGTYRNMNDSTQLAIYYKI